MKWETPELVILAKGKPEEAVLHACKLLEGLSEKGPGAGQKLERRCVVWADGVWADCQKRALT